MHPNKLAQSLQSIIIVVDKETDEITSAMMSILDMEYSEVTSNFGRSCMESALVEMKGMRNHAKNILSASEDRVVSLHKEYHKAVEPKFVEAQLSLAELTVTTAYLDIRISRIASKLGHTESVKKAS